MNKGEQNIAADAEGRLFESVEPLTVGSSLLASLNSPLATSKCKP
jgi:hypothetical protein